MHVVERADAGEHQERVDAALGAKRNVGVEPVADHERAGAVKVRGSKDGVEHRLLGLADHGGLPPSRVAQPRPAGTGAGPGPGLTRERHVRVARHKVAAAVLLAGLGLALGAGARQVPERLGELEIRQLGVDPADHSAHARVQGTFLEQRGKVGALKVHVVLGVGAAEVLNADPIELLLDAGHAHHVRLAVLGQLEHLLEVQRCGGRRGDHLGQFRVDAELLEPVQQNAPTLARIVRDKHDVLLARAQLIEHRRDAGQRIGAGPQHAVAVCGLARTAAAACTHQTGSCRSAQ